MFDVDGSLLIAVNVFVVIELDSIVDRNEK